MWWISLLILFSFSWSPNWALVPEESVFYPLLQCSKENIVSGVYKSKGTHSELRLKKKTCSVYRNLLKVDQWPNVVAKAIKLLVENVGISHNNLRFGRGFLGMTLKSWATKEK